MNRNLLSSHNEIFLYERAKQVLATSTSCEIHPAVSLIELIEAGKKGIYSKEEWKFIWSPSRIDLVITKNYGSREITFAFESDSALHDDPTQQKRDLIKNQVLKKSGIPLMRFRPLIHYKRNQFEEVFIDAVF